MSESLTSAELARYIDHTLLKPEATSKDIEKLCQEAKEYRFRTVCVNGCRVELAASLLEDTDILISTVIGFPLGAMDADAKRYETEVAVDMGAGEIDVVMNIGRFKDGYHGYIVRELRDIAEAADERPVKMILETSLLNDEEIVQACKLALEAEVHFVKTSTGFGSAGATIEHVKLMRETVGRNCGVKASGGIRDTKTAIAMIQAGATRLGTSSGFAIVQGLASDFSTAY